MLKIKKLSEVLSKRVYSDSGELFGEIEEVHLADNKVDGWRIKITGNIGSNLGGARGVIIPHSYIKAVGDVFIINSVALPSREEPESFQEDI